MNNIENYVQLVIEREGLVAKFALYPAKLWNILSKNENYGKWGYNPKMGVFFIGQDIANEIYQIIYYNYKIVSEVDSRTETEKMGRWDTFRKNKEDTQRKNAYNYYHEETTDEETTITLPTIVILNALSVLGCDEFNDRTTVKIKYRNLVKLYHPDISKTEDTNKIKEINAAWDLLKNVELPLMK